MRDRYSDGEPGIFDEMRDPGVRHGQGIVHTQTQEEYIKQGRDDNQRARQCRDCKDNNDGYCNKYKKWASNARDACNNNIFRTYVCPNCGGKLIKRTAKTGFNVGSHFLSCDKYPECMFLKPLIED